MTRAETATISPALKRRIETLGYVTGETPANPVAWLVAELEGARLTLAADQGRRIDGVVAGANMDTGFITIEVEPSAVSGTQIRQRAIVVLLAVDKAGPPS